MKRAIKQIAQTVLAPVAPLAWRLQPRPALLVLMYHRVLPVGHPDRAIEQPGMYVAPDTLDMHLAVLKRHMTIMHLDTWLSSAIAGEPLPRQACALTFDDGWQDNFEHAFPVLQRHSAPATIFLVSGMTGTRREFWPNRMARLLSQSGPDEPLPDRLAEVLAPVVVSARAAGRWSREDLDRAIVLAKGFAEPQIDDLLTRMQEKRGTDVGTRAVLDADELRTMAASGLVRFGSHTRTHCRFRGTLAPEVLEEEIAGSRSEIAACVGDAAVGIFCYPNGDTTAAAVDVVRNYAGAVTTQRGWHHSGADRYLMQRVGVHDDISDRPAGFLARLSGWS